jgi:hypothetical protein
MDPTVSTSDNNMNGTAVAEPPTAPPEASPNATEEETAATGPDETENGVSQAGEQEAKDEAVTTATRLATDEEYRELAGRVPVVWPEPDKGTQAHIDKSIFYRLRGLDYLGRQKLMMLMAGLHSEQYETRRDEDAEPFAQPLLELIPLMEQVEKDVIEVAFNERLTGAVFGLPQEAQHKLLQILETTIEDQESGEAEETTDDDEPQDEADTAKVAEIGLEAG